MPAKSACACTESVYNLNRQQIADAAPRELGLEQKMATNITWSAKNNSSFLNGSRPATSVRAAVIAGREYVRNELCGEGTLTLYEDDRPARQDECSIFTGFKWVTRTDF